MSFFDDLKKPAEVSAKKESQTFTDTQRQEIAENLCGEIKWKCTDAKKKGKCSYHGYCIWSKSEHWDDYGSRSLRVEASVLNSFANRGRGHGEAYLYCTQSERDKILVFLRRALMANGFPADVLRPYEYNDGNFMNRKMIYCIEVDVRW